MTRIHYKTNDHDTRPWGTWEVIDVEETQITKRIIVQPGHSISLQYHNHRHEHWTITKGTAQVTIDAEKRAMKVGQSIDIPAGTHHRIENEGDDILEFIEIQTGSILDEDDIVRLEDNYGRV